MENRKEDRRVVKTKNALYEGLCVLLKEKDIKEITVRELTDMVDLNRATFYLHFADIYALLEEINDVLVDELKELIENHFPIDFGLKGEVFFANLLEFIKQKEKYTVVLLSKNSSYILREKLNRVIQDVIMDYLRAAAKNIKAPDIEYICDFVVSGYMAMVVRWVQSGMKKPVEQLARQMNRLAGQGLAMPES